jgi:hypothetical protein
LSAADMRSIRNVFISVRSLAFDIILSPYSVV